MQFRFSPQAESELEEISLYLVSESGSVEIADRVVDSILGTIGLLAKFPYIGRKRDDDLSVGVRSFPAENYIIFYRIRNEEVQVIRILHGHRDISSILAGG